MSPRDRRIYIIQILYLTLLKKNISDKLDARCKFHTQDQEANVVKIAFKRNYDRSLNREINRKGDSDRSLIYFYLLYARWPMEKCGFNEGERKRGENRIA